MVMNAQRPRTQISHGIVLCIFRGGAFLFFLFTLFNFFIFCLSCLIIKFLIFFFCVCVAVTCFAIFIDPFQNKGLFDELRGAQGQLKNKLDQELGRSIKFSAARSVARAAYPLGEPPQPDKDTSKTNSEPHQKKNSSS